MRFIQTLMINHSLTAAPVSPSPTASTSSKCSMPRYTPCSAEGASCNATSMLMHWLRGSRFSICAAIQLFDLPPQTTANLVQLPYGLNSHAIASEADFFLPLNILSCNPTRWQSQSKSIWANAMIITPSLATTGDRLNHSICPGAWTF